MSGQGGTIVVLTALRVEYAAVEEHLVALRPHTDKGTLFEVGWLNGTPWRVALAEIGEGNQRAAVITERAVALFRPQVVMFVGVAGALKDDVQLGDVVVATHIYAYHGGKEEGGEFLARPRAWAVDHELEQLARYIGRKDSWVRPSAGSGTRDDRSPEVHLKPVAVGEIVLNSAESPLREQLRRHYQDAVAIEMESAGVAHAAHLNAGLPTLVVRGISDRADGGKNHADRAESQQVAARNAAAFAFSVIRMLRTGDDEHSSDESLETSTIFIPASTSTPAAATRWRGGEEVACGDHVYLLHDDLLEERPSADGALVVRRALARQLKPEPASHARYVWLRQAEARQGTPTEATTRALAREHDLLRRLRPQHGSGLPLPGLCTSHGRTASLTLPWPASRVSKGPCPTLADAFGSGASVTPADLHRLLTGLAGVCKALARLHREGVAHRHLDPSMLIERDDGSLVLRDLGLAAYAPTPGEGPDPYRAPEQRRRPVARGRTANPGSWTDVYQLGAVVYHLITGRPPNPGQPPLPPRALAPHLPERADRVLTATLAPAPADRPTPHRLREELLRARDDVLPGRGA